MAVWLKQLKALDSTCPFQLQHDVFQMDELHLPATEHCIATLHMAVKTTL